MIHVLKQWLAVPAEAIGLVAFMAGLGLLLQIAQEFLTRIS